MNNPVVVEQQTVILTEEGREDVRELVAVEQPYRVALNDREIGSSMVLATGLEEFGAGFLFGQGYIDHPGQVREVLVCPEGRIEVHADVEEDFAPKEVIITSGCGGTGKISREMLEGRIGPLQEYSLGFAEAGEFIRQVLLASDLGQKTHCVHGCGLWAEGRMQVFFEDIGRHNAVDKVIGAILLGRAPAAAAVYTTGRLTSDMVLKCARVGIPIVMSRTSASSLALAIARQAGLTLVCYARPGRFNIYNAPDRIVNP
jgi:FdhD protein